jgi:BASS family bile acid:Na+ symporter
MPAAAFAMGHAFGIKNELLLGVILVGCVPGAMASNVLTLAARGNVSYSVSLTTSATLLSPLVVPAALYLTTRQSNVDSEALVWQAFVVLTTQVVGPVVAGHLSARRFSAVESFMRRVGSTVANLVILWIIAVVVNANHERLSEVGPQLAGALLAINLSGYCAGYAAGIGMRLPDPMQRALTLEIGLQNAGLGSVMAAQLFPDTPEVALPPALYTFGCMLTGTILAQVWSLRRIQQAADDKSVEVER